MNTILSFRRFSLFLLSVCLLSCSNTTTDPIEKRLEAILQEMTLDEKIGQLNQTDGGDINQLKERIRKGEIGAIFNIDARQIDDIQRIAVEESRLGIPIVFARDVIHGYHTIFPIPLAQAATWNPALVEQGCRVSAVEATAEGIRWTFSPMVDIARDPRWGRIAEGYGEDTYLTSVMGAAAVRGYQTDSMATCPTSMAACTKHFVAYGASEGGRDYNVTWIPENMLREVYLPPFKACVDAGTASLMASFNEINMVPNHVNAHTNTEILRDEWNYDGLLDGDWGALGMLLNHGMAADKEEAALKAINAGLDMDMAAQIYAGHLKTLVRNKQVSEKQIDEAVRRVLRMKLRLGLFEQPYTHNIPIDLPAHYAAAQQAAEESAILLKNNNVLPLNPARLRKVAVVGPLADSPRDQVGTWCFDADYNRCITPLQAIEQQYGDRLQIIYEPLLNFARDRKNITVPASLHTADVILCFLGEEALMSGEGKCMADLSLKGNQTQMVNRLAELGKPLVLIVMAGRPLTMEQEFQKADAVLYALHGGTMAGPALSRLIFGEVSPSGKLPVTMPRMTGQIPIYYNHHRTGRPADHDPRPLYDVPVGAAQFSFGDLCYYLDAGALPLYPFGYGLSYTTFEYSPVTLSDTLFLAGQPLTATCTVTNTGNRPAKEAVQCYLRDVVGEAATRPVRQLIGFEKIELQPGESKTVTFQVTDDNLKYWHQETDHLSQRVYLAADKGQFQLWIAPNSVAGTPVSFRLNEDINE